MHAADTNTAAASNDHTNDHQDEDSHSTSTLVATDLSTASPLSSQPASIETLRGLQLSAVDDGATSKECTQLAVVDRDNDEAQFGRQQEFALAAAAASVVAPQVRRAPDLYLHNDDDDDCDGGERVKRQKCTDICGHSKSISNSKSCVNHRTSNDSINIKINVSSSAPNISAATHKATQQQQEQQRRREQHRWLAGLPRNPLNSMSTKTKSGILSLVVILVLLVNVWINFTKATVDEGKLASLIIASSTTNGGGGGQPSNTINNIINTNGLLGINRLSSSANISINDGGNALINFTMTNNLHQDAAVTAPAESTTISSTNSEPNNSNENSVLTNGRPNTSKAHQGHCSDSSSTLPKVDTTTTATSINSNTNNNNNSIVLSDNDKYFDINFACKTFGDCANNKDAVPLYNYIAGFKELMKFFNSLGSIFVFVTSDLESKINILESYRRLGNGECNPNYETIQSVVEYETRENLLRDPKRPSGSRTILRLHRALEFLSALMFNLSKLDDETETATACREAYSATLANHHSWTIKTVASFAMRSLPHKKRLVENVIGKAFLSKTPNINDDMLKLANVTGRLFTLVDKFYDENNIQDLP